MKTILLAPITAAALLLLAGPAPAQQPDGFYENGKPLALDVRKADLSAQDNANTRFHLFLAIPFDPAPVLLSKVLVVDGIAHKQVSGGSSANEESHIGFQIEGLERARKVGALLGVQPLLRAHPGHRLAVRFVPRAPQFAVGDPVRVTLQIENVGESAVAFMQGGANRAARDNQYDFVARKVGKQVPDIGTGLHFGGLAATRAIQPGEVFEATVNLSRWFAFDETGTYEVLGTYALTLFASREDVRVVWQDYATAAFTVQIGSRPASEGG